MQTIVSLLSNVTVVLATRLIVLGLVTWAGLSLIKQARRILERRVVQQADDPSRRARLATLVDAVVRTAQLLLLFAVSMMALMVVGIDIGPVLAAAGIAGLAVSLGAQTLIKDFIGGALILLEDQFRVGDTIQVQDALGTVERMSLRASYLRDAEGRMWVVPNGEVRIMSNSSRDWSRAVVDLNLGLNADVKQAVAVLEEAMVGAAQEPALRDMLLETPVVEGYNGISDWAVQVRLKAMTRAGQQWATARLLRERGLTALCEAGIPLASRAAGPERSVEPA